MKGKEPATVRELLTEMKDISELIVDLAYSAVILDSKEIAEEVKRLEERMDKLLYEIRVTAMVAARNPKQARQLAGLLQVAGAAEDISNAAGDIIKLLDTSIEHRPFLPSLFSKADEKIRTLVITQNSDMVDKTLGELGIESETGTRVIAICRGEKWRYAPQDSFVLKRGDRIVVRGVEDGYLKLREYAEGRKKWKELD
ncbi:MAG: TrkA C-terminal domain-containing protein [Candidatus Thermoplasmatota archaeon]|nr:TrkA C-terminal domain-containing protein [Candidatus Thermoplasmatota archaeon]